MNTKPYGFIGEELARKYLIKNKYKILTQNFSCKLGEIDIIAEIDKTIVFVEVKARNTLKFGMPREAVTEYKQMKIKQVANWYLKSIKGFDMKCRFDVIEIIGENLNHIVNAF